MTSQWKTHYLVILTEVLIIFCATVSSFSHSPYEQDPTLSKPLPISIKIAESHQSNEASSNPCPSFLSLIFFYNESWHDIRLVRASSIRSNRIPVFLSNPENVVEYKHNMGVQLCHYTDIYTSGTFTVHKAESSYILDGTFRSDGNLYAIKTEYNTKNKNSLQQKVVHYIQHLSRGDIHHPPLKSSRQKRQAKTQYNIGVLVVADTAIFKRWYDHSNATSNQERINDAISNIRYYFSHIMNEVNMRYQSIQDTDYNINVFLIGFTIAQNTQASPWTEEEKVGDKVDVYKAIIKFKQWVSQMSSQLPPFDHAILFTGNDLVGPSVDGSVSSATTGQSYVGGICRYDKVSVVEDKSRFKSSTTAAHEIGHNLGAGHDGQDNTCSPSMQYIMTPLIDKRTPDNYYNIFTFSSCSKNELKRSLRALPEYENCLQDTPDVYNETELRKYLEILPGQKYSYDIQCQNIYGSGSYFCGTQTYGEKICRSIPCHNPEKDDCFIPSDIAAAQGTTCGDKKWCDGGHCVRDDRAPSVNPNCIYGDYRGRLLNKSVTCAEMIEKSPYLCYHKTNLELCCASCAKVYRPEKAGCEYGDRADWCSTLPERGCEINADSCCESCKPRQTVDTECADEQSDICKNMKPHQCYDLGNREKCCRTCERYKRELSLHSACPYGDKDPSCKKIPKKDCYYSDFRIVSKCCRTCQSTNIPGCEYGDKISGCVRNVETCSKDSGQCCETCNVGSTKPVSVFLVVLSILFSICKTLQLSC